MVCGELGKYKEECGVLKGLDADLLPKNYELSSNSLFKVLRRLMMLLKRGMKNMRIRNEDIEEYFTNMRRCTKCILPETFPGIEFNENGVCNYCLNYEPVKVLGEKEFERVLSKYRNRSEKYDCIVPISGGRDSSFVLHQMVKKYKMRVLTLTVDSGAILPEGYRNIKRVTEVLNVEHVWLKDEKQIETARQNTKIKFHDEYLNEVYKKILLIF